MSRVYQWRGDNLGEFQVALVPFNATAVVDAGKLHIRRPLSPEIKPLELGDTVTIMDNGMEIRRAPNQDDTTERWMVWKGDNLQEVIDFMDFNEWEVGLKVDQQKLFIKTSRDQELPTVLNPGDTIVENKGGLWFRRKETRQ